MTEAPPLPLRPYSQPAEPDAPHPTHHPEHPPVLITWPTDFGIGRDVDLSEGARLIRAALDQCGECSRYWAHRVADGDAAVIVHILMSAWGRTQMHAIDWREFYPSAAQEIILPVVRHTLKKALKTADEMGKEERLEVLDSAVTVLSSSTGLLIEEAKAIDAEKGNPDIRE